MSKGNIILLILLVLSLGYVGQIQYTKYQKNQKEIKLAQKRSPQCYISIDLKILRFFKDGYYHFIYIDKDNVAGYLRYPEESAFVEYLDLNPDKKIKCPKVATIDTGTRLKLKEINLIDDLRRILTELDML